MAVRIYTEEVSIIYEDGTNGGIYSSGDVLPTFNDTTEEIEFSVNGTRSIRVHYTDVLDKAGVQAAATFELTKTYLATIVNFKTASGGSGAVSDAYIGEIRMYSGSTAPTDWVICDGTLLDPTIYTALDAVISNTYGGDGVTTIAIPDLRDKFPIGVSGTKPLGTTGGSDAVTLTEAQMPSHNHSVGVSNLVGNDEDPTGGILANAGVFDLEFDNTATVTGNAADAFIEDTGGSNPIDITPPFLSLNFIIKVV